MELVTQVRAGMEQRMMDVDWLDSETRQLALEKVCGKDALLYDLFGHYLGYWATERFG